jgi:hypothetical protein
MVFLVDRYVSLLVFSLDFALEVGSRSLSLSSGTLDN